MSPVPWAILLRLCIVASAGPSTASSGKQRLFVTVISAPSNHRLRSTLRETWVGRLRRAGVQYRFFIGEPTAEDGLDTTAALEDEAARYHDLLRLDVAEGYAQLSKKVPMSLGWAASAADNGTIRNFEYVLKVDDDVFINTAELLAELTAVEAGSGALELLYLGAKWSGSSPHRTPSSKHYVPRSAYPLDAYPPYIEGAAYVVSRRVADYVYRNLNDLRALGAVEDVTMAVWLLGLQLHPTHSSKFISRNVMAGGGLAVLPDRRLQACRNDLIAMPDLTAEQLLAMHAMLTGRRAVCDVFDDGMWEL